MTLESALHAAVLACGLYLAVVYCAYGSLALVGAYENAWRRREAALEDYETGAESPFAAGVSVLLAAYQEETTIVPAVGSLLALRYPELELVVVNDGSRDATLDRLREAFALYPVERLGRGVVETEPVRAFYRSAADPRLTVIDKENGGKADSLNAGLNVSRHRYVCGVDADAVFAPDALVRTMRAFTKEPELVVGLTSYIEIAADPTETMRAEPGRRPVHVRSLIPFQALDYLRSFFNNRIAWSRLGFMLCAVGAFQVWRRDVLDEVGGWSRDYTCEDIELTFRVHEVMRRTRRPYRIVCLPEAVGATEGPDTVRKLVSQRERWQRVTLETWWAYRRMFLNPRYGSVGLLGMPFYLLSEILAPLFEIATVLTVVAGAVAGLIEWPYAGLVMLLIALVNGVFNATAVLAGEVQARSYAAGSIAKLLALAPFELVFYRPAVSWARVKGTWRYLRGDKGWHKFARNVREGTA